MSSSHAYGRQPCYIHMPIVLKPGSLNFLKPSGPVQACRGTALPSLYYHVQPTGGALKEWVLVTLSLKCQLAGTWPHHNLRAGMRKVQVQFHTQPLAVPNAPKRSGFKCPMPA